MSCSRAQRLLNPLGQPESPLVAATLPVTQSAECTVARDCAVHVLLCSGTWRRRRLISRGVPAHFTMRRRPGKHRGLRQYVRGYQA